MADFLFKQNNELTLLGNEHPLYKENTFLNKEIDKTPLPKFTESKDNLPVPIWDNHKDYINCYWRTWEIAFSNLCQPIEGTGFVSNFIDTAFNGCLFMWDSSFILMFGKYAQRIFDFQATLDNFYSHQHADGFICREIDEKTGLDRFTRFDPTSTGPDVMAWCEWEYYLSFGDKKRLERVFPPLMAYHQWMTENRTWPDGTYWSSGWGCGMDNLPRLMDGYHTVFSHGHMIWVDACMQQIHNCNILINMAEILDRKEYIETIETERENLIKVVNEKLWDEKTGFYYDLYKNGELNMVRHIGAFWGLISKTIPKDRAERIVEYLRDENEFKTPNRVPSLSKSHKDFKDFGDYWRGGVWAPTTYMVLKGLDNYKKYDLSHEIAMDFLCSVTEVFKETNTLFENYSPEFINNNKPSKGKPAKADFVGWSGLGPITILFEYVFGIKPDFANNKIIWDVRLTERHGVEKYPFGLNGELTLICEARENDEDTPKITICGNVSVELEVYWGKNNKKTFYINN